MPNAESCTLLRLHHVDCSQVPAAGGRSHGSPCTLPNARASGRPYLESQSPRANVALSGTRQLCAPIALQYGMAARVQRNERDLVSGLTPCRHVTIPILGLCSNIWLHAHNVAEHAQCRGFPFEVSCQHVRVHHTWLPTSSAL
jgi:hypothetical protein